jgi:hypothetical protein
LDKFHYMADDCFEGMYNDHNLKTKVFVCTPYMSLLCFYQLT